MSIPVFDPTAALDTILRVIRPILSWVVGVPMVLIALALLLGFVGGLLYITLRLIRLLYVILTRPAVSVRNLSAGQRVMFRDGQSALVNYVDYSDGDLYFIGFAKPFTRLAAFYTPNGGCTNSFSQAIVHIFE